MKASITLPQKECGKRSSDKKKPKKVTEASEEVTKNEKLKFLLPTSLCDTLTTQKWRIPATFSFVTIPWTCPVCPMDMSFLRHTNHQIPLRVFSFISLSSPEFLNITQKCIKKCVGCTSTYTSWLLLKGNWHSKYVTCSEECFKLPVDCTMFVPSLYSSFLPKKGWNKWKKGHKKWPISDLGAQNWKAQYIEDHPHPQENDRFILHKSRGPHPIKVS